jgi:hypothetical protein
MDYVWVGCVYLVMQRPGVRLLKPLSNKKLIIEKKRKHD